MKSREKNCMTRHTNFIAGILLIALSGWPPLARAQEITRLTEDNIRVFIEKTSTITSGRESDMTSAEIDLYLEDHIHPDARFKSTMRYNIPGFDIQQTTMSIDKGDFIEDVHKAGETVSGYESQIEITDIKISSDGTKATLKTRTMESGKMPVADHIEQQDVPIEGMSTCTQILALSKENIIQMVNATCVTDIHFQTFDP